MPTTADLRYAFNRGEIGKTALARVDAQGLRLAAETQENFLPMPQGPMMLRPGSAYLGNTKSDRTGRLIPFIFSRDDTALLELTEGTLRVWVDDALVTRPSVTTKVKNAAFDGTGGWRLRTTDGAEAEITGGQLRLAAVARGSKASATQPVPVTGANQDKVHALRVVVARGPVFFKVGSTPGEDDLVTRTLLGQGTHSLAFTPDDRFVIEFETDDRNEKLIDSCTVEGSGVLELDTVWTNADFDSMEWVQSGDVVFFASNQKPQKIERRSNNSWSVVDYRPNFGPLRVQKPREKDIRLHSTVYEGNGRLIASDPVFKDYHVGSVIRAFVTGQTKLSLVAGEDTWSQALRVAGANESRRFGINISGNWSGMLELFHSLEGPDVGFSKFNMQLPNQGGNMTTSFRQNGVYNIDDAPQYAGYNNSVVWYRVGFREGTIPGFGQSYRSGVATILFGTDGVGDITTAGGATGYARITRVVSPTIAEIEVLRPFPSLTSTKDWEISEWNSEDGFPAAVTIFDGRLWWAGKDRIWGSVSDDYENFDVDFEGDAGPINRSIGSGPVDNIGWLLALARLLTGGSRAVSSIRSSNFDEPLTPSNFTIKAASTRGARHTRPGQMDSRGIYIHANGRQVFELAYDINSQDYIPIDLTDHNLDIGLDGLSRLAVSNSPDNHAYLIRDDGQLIGLLRARDGESQLMSWWRLTRSDGVYEDVAILPGDIEDKVYVLVQMDDQRFIECFARRDECVGAPLSKNLDSHVVYSGAATTSITGLDHLVGKFVFVWGSETASAEHGKFLGRYRVKADGSIGVLPVSVVRAVVGLRYTGTFKSAKLAYGAGLSLGMLKRVDQISFVLVDTNTRGLFFGQDDSATDPLPRIEDATDVDPDKVWTQYDKRVMAIPGRWDVDARICLRAIGPFPVTVSAAFLEVDTSARQSG